MTGAGGRDFAPELQGAVEYEMRRMGIKSITINHRGNVGNLIDWWVSQIAVADGKLYGNREFITISGTAGIVWPWNGTAAVVGTSPAMS